jgi:predicted nucleic acid-binding protein
LRYWDASAVMALLVEETGSPLALGWLREDPEVCTWGLTRVEVTSAIERCAREEGSAVSRRTLLERAERLHDAMTEVIDVHAVRSRAMALLARHALRAADAAQLGAALLVAEGEPRSLPFVCFDRRLTEAASREGFPVLSWPE